jgi:hypothetical protein
MTDKPSTAKQIQMLAEALVETGLRLWMTSHNNTPGAQHVHHWMCNISPGDLVLEVSSPRHDRNLDRVGVLVAITMTGKTRYSDVYTICTIDGREYRWDNATFVRIPQSAADNTEIFDLGQLP